MIKTFQCTHSGNICERTFTFALCDTEIRLVSIVRRLRHRNKTELEYHYDTDLSTTGIPTIPENVARAAIAFFRRQIKLIRPVRLLSEAARDRATDD